LRLDARRFVEAPRHVEGTALPGSGVCDLCHQIPIPRRKLSTPLPRTEAFESSIYRTCCSVETFFDRNRRPTERADRSWVKNDQMERLAAIT